MNSTNAFNGSKRPLRKSDQFIIKNTQPIGSKKPQIGIILRDFVNSGQVQTQFIYEKI